VEARLERVFARVRPHSRDGSARDRSDALHHGSQPWPIAA